MDRDIQITGWSLLLVMMLYFGGHIIVAAIRFGLPL